MNISGYLDVIGNWGSGPYGRPDFPTMESLLDHMDYLQIDRKIVWHQQATDLHPLWGNRMLLEDIDRSTEARERFIPAMVIAPAMTIEIGPMDHLHQVFQTGRTKAIRIAPVTSRFAVSHIEPVLADLACYHPVVFWDFRLESSGPSDIRDMLDLSVRFPEIHFVLTQAYWPFLSSIMDMMRRRENILTDISWMHTRETIELLIELFGPTRILFGTDWKTHYAAAIAALQRAKISQEERELIAHGNAERLLEIPPIKKRLFKPTPKIEKPLWEKFLAGQPLDEVPIIDAHGHTPPHTRGWFNKYVEMEAGIEQMQAQMDRLGINRQLVAPEPPLFGDPVQGARLCNKLLKKYPRFSGYLPFNPHYAEELAVTLDELFAVGFFIGFKLLPGYWRVSIQDPRYQKAFAYADQYARPILIHTWNDNNSFNSPGMLTDIVKKYPNATFILGHSGGGNPGRADAEHLATENDNVLLEFCGTFLAHRLWQDTFEAVGYDKVVFGSDTPAHGQEWELGRFLSTPVPDAKLMPVLAANIQKVLDNMLPTPKPQHK